MQALLIIDMQMEMQRRLEAGRDCINPDAPSKIEALAQAFRRKGWPVIHIYHAASDPNAPFHPKAATYAAMPCSQPQGQERVFVKTTSSAFASTDLAEYLRGLGLGKLVITGTVAGFCVNSTTRHGADLGFEMVVLRDAILGFDLPTAGQSAKAIFDVSLALLEADFAQISESAAYLA